MKDSLNFGLSAIATARLIDVIEYDTFYELCWTIWILVLPLVNAWNLSLPTYYIQYLKIGVCSHATGEHSRQLFFYQVRRTTGWWYLVQIGFAEKFVPVFRTAHIVFFFMGRGRSRGLPSKATSSWTQEGKKELSFDTGVTEYTDGGTQCTHGTVPGPRSNFPPPLPTDFCNPQKISRRKQNFLGKEVFSRSAGYARRTALPMVNTNISAKHQYFL